MRKALIIITFFASVFFSASSSYAKELDKSYKLIGKGVFTYYLWNVYNAELYSKNGEYNSNLPIILKLTYLHKINGKDIAKSTIDEIVKQGFDDAEKLEKWQKKLETIIPDVVPQDSLSGYYNPPKSTVELYKNDVFVGKIDDKLLSSLFINIWLSEKTSAPNLRLKLIGAKK